MTIPLATQDEVGFHQSPPSPPSNVVDSATQLKHTFQQLTPQQQERILQDMVHQCAHSQLCFLQDIISPRLKVDFLHRLPLKIALGIVWLVDDPWTLGQMATVSHHWHKVMKDETIWRIMCEQNGYTPPPTLMISYRAHFIQKHRTALAWQQGGKVKVVDQGIKDLVTSLQFDDKYIVVGCHNHRIEVFDTSTGNKVRSLLGHEGGVWALEFKGGEQDNRVLVSAGCDRDVRVWNLETGELQHILRGHLSTVRCLKIKDNDPKTVVTGSRDASLRVWDIEQGIERYTLYGHRNSVRCIAISGDILVSGSYDNTARVWDLTTGLCRHVLLGHESFIYSIVTDGIKVAAGSLATHIMVWSVETGESLATLYGHTSLVGQLELVSGATEGGSTLVSGGADGCLRVFDWNYPFDCLQRISAHDNSITCLQCDDRWILSSGNDGKVKLFDRKREGRLVRTLVTPAKTVWKTQFNESTAVMVRPFDAHSNERVTVLEIHDFSA